MKLLGCWEPSKISRKLRRTSFIGFCCVDFVEEREKTIIIERETIEDRERGVTSHTFQSTEDLRSFLTTKENIKLSTVTFLAGSFL